MSGPKNHYWKVPFKDCNYTFFSGNSKIIWDHFGNFLREGIEESSTVPGFFMTRTFLRPPLEGFYLFGQIALTTSHKAKHGRQIFKQECSGRKLKATGFQNSRFPVGFFEMDKGVSF